MYISYLSLLYRLIVKAFNNRKLTILLTANTLQTRKKGVRCKNYNVKIYLLLLHTAITPLYYIIYIKRRVLHFFILYCSIIYFISTTIYYTQLFTFIYIYTYIIFTFIL